MVCKVAVFKSLSSLQIGFGYNPFANYKFFFKNKIKNKNKIMCILCTYYTSLLPVVSEVLEEMDLSGSITL